MNHCRRIAAMLCLLVLCVLDIMLIHMLQTYARAFFDGKGPEVYDDRFRESDYMQNALMKERLEELKFFPVPESISTPEAKVSFENSWMYERTYGGVRGHEGCDIMASLNERGRYPVVSMSDGTVEKLGWLRQGGYRIGIRTPHGGYCYYAHLYAYAPELKENDVVKAGQLIGYMGDSGYSDTAGTVGKFAVHLHVGYYITTEEEELSLNPYPILKLLENKKLKYDY